MADVTLVDLNGGFVKLVPVVHGDAAAFILCSPKAD